MPIPSLPHMGTPGVEPGYPGPQPGAFSRWAIFPIREAPVGFEPTIRRLQRLALTTWLRGHLKKAVLQTPFNHSVSLTRTISKVIVRGLSWHLPLPYIYIISYFFYFFNLFVRRLDFLYHPIYYISVH